MKIEMEIKEGKITIVDRSIETKLQTKFPCTSASGTSNIDLEKTFGITPISVNPEETKHDIWSRVKKIKEKHNEKKYLIPTEKNKTETTMEDMMSVSEEIVKSKIKDPKNPNRFNTGQVKITMGTIDRPDIDQIADIDKNEVGYDRIRVFDSMERTADITVINDGPAETHFIVNRNGIDHEEESWSQNEITLYAGEAWKIFDVHELRIRSETQGNKYRITEDEVIIGSTIRSVS